jgi:hypothetical protein
LDLLIGSRVCGHDGDYLKEGDEMFMFCFNTKINVSNEVCFSDDVYIPAKMI